MNQCFVRLVFCHLRIYALCSCLTMNHSKATPLLIFSPNTSAQHEFEELQSGTNTSRSMCVSIHEYAFAAQKHSQLIEKTHYFDFLLKINSTSSTKQKVTLVPVVQYFMPFTNMCRLLLADHKPLQNTHVLHFIIKYSLISLSFFYLKFTYCCH